MPEDNEQRFVPLESCYYFDELHDSHVDAWIRSLPGPPELPKYAKLAFDLSGELYDLEYGPCEDVARKQKRIEELKARLGSISKDCTRLEGEGSEDSSLAISYAVRQWKISPKLSGKEMIFMVESEAGLSREYAYDTIRKWIQPYHPDHEPGKRGRKGIPKNA